MKTSVCLDHWKIAHYRMSAHILKEGRIEKWNKTHLHCLQALKQANFQFLILSLEVPKNLEKKRNFLYFYFINFFLCSPRAQVGLHVTRATIKLTRAGTRTHTGFSTMRASRWVTQATFKCCRRELVRILIMLWHDTLGR